MKPTSISMINKKLAPNDSKEFNMRNENNWMNIIPATYSDVNAYQENNGHL